MVYHVCNRIRTNLEFSLGHFSVSSSTFMTASWLMSFVSAESSQTILLIDRSEPIFESQTGGKIRKLSKNDKIFDVFC